MAAILSGASPSLTVAVAAMQMVLDMLNIANNILYPFALKVNRSRRVPMLAVHVAINLVQRKASDQSR